MGRDAGPALMGACLRAAGLGARWASFRFTDAGRMPWCVATFRSGANMRFGWEVGRVETCG